jgi:stage II sporulation protein D
VSALIALGFALGAALSAARPTPVDVPPDLPDLRDDSEEIRILLGTDSGALRLSGAGLRVRTADSSAAQVTADRLALRCSRGRLAVSSLPSASPVAAEATVEASGPLRALGRALRGRVEVQCDGDRWLAINVLPIETYLGAVLGAEMPPGFPSEALKAQAVAARSYAMVRKIEARDAGRSYHLGATVLSQVYLGLDHEDPRTAAAVAATRGEVLALGVTPVEAYFHASCGGRTETGAAALDRSLSYLKSVSCPCENHSPFAHWRVEITGAALGKAVGLSAATDCEILSRTSSGRASRVQIRSSRSGERTMLGTELRTLLGYQKLPSTAFDVHRDGQRFVFEGRGSGHGAGMCQWGARIFAEQGKTYREILEHYYPGTSIERIY